MIDFIHWLFEEYTVVAILLTTCLLVLVMSLKEQFGKFWDEVDSCENIDVHLTEEDII